MSDEDKRSFNLIKSKGKLIKGDKKSFNDLENELVKNKVMKRKKDKEDIKEGFIKEGENVEGLDNDMREGLWRVKKKNKRRL
jgi:hypothetical protein